MPQRQFVLSKEPRKSNLRLSALSLHKDGAQMHEAFDEEQTDYTSTVKSNNLILAVKNKAYSADYPYYTNTEVYLDNKPIYPALLTDGADDGYDYYYVDWRYTNAEQHQIHVRVTDKNKQEEPNNYYVSMETDDTLARLEAVMWFIGSASDTTNKVGRFLPYSMFANPVEFDPYVNKYVIPYSQNWASSYEDASMLAFQVYPEKEDDIWAFISGGAQIWTDEDGEEYYVLPAAMGKLGVSHADGSGYNEYVWGVSTASRVHRDQCFKLCNSDLVSGYKERFKELDDSMPDEYYGAWLATSDGLSVVENVVDANYELRVKLYEMMPFKMDYFKGGVYPYSVSAYTSYMKSETWLEDDAPEIEATLNVWASVNGRSAVIPTLNGMPCAYSMNGRNIIYPRSKFYNGWNTIGYVSYDITTGEQIINEEFPIYRNGGDTRVHDIKLGNEFIDFSPYDYAIGKQTKEKVNASIAGMTRRYREHLYKVNTDDTQGFTNTRNIYLGWLHDTDKGFTLYDSAGLKYNYRGWVYRYQYGSSLPTMIEWNNGDPLPVTGGVNMFEFRTLGSYVNPYDYLHKYVYTVKSGLGIKDGGKVKFMETSSATTREDVVHSKYMRNNEYPLCLVNRINNGSIEPTRLFMYWSTTNNNLVGDSYDYGVNTMTHKAGISHSSQLSLTADDIQRNIFKVIVNADDGVKKTYKFKHKYIHYNYYAELIKDGLYICSDSNSITPSRFRPTSCFNNAYSGNYKCTGVTYNGTDYSFYDSIPLNTSEDGHILTLHTEHNVTGETKDMYMFVARNTSNPVSNMKPIKSDVKPLLRKEFVDKEYIRFITEESDIDDGYADIAVMPSGYHYTINSVTAKVLRADGTIISSGDMPYNYREADDMNVYYIPDLKTIFKNNVDSYALITVDFTSSQGINATRTYLVANFIGWHDRYDKYIFRDPECTTTWNALYASQIDNNLFTTIENFTADTTFYTRDPKVHIKYAGLDWYAKPLAGYAGVYYIKPEEECAGIHNDYPNTYPSLECYYGNEPEAFTTITLKRTN